MKLNIQERIMLAGILPNESNFLTLKIVRELQEKLSFTEEEIKEFELRQTVQDGQSMLNWNQKKEKEVEIPIGEKATDIITEALTKLNKENKLTQQIYSLYEKFIK